jgi:hypothetical protein
VRVDTRKTVGEDRPDRGDRAQDPGRRIGVVLGQGVEHRLPRRDAIAARDAIAGPDRRTRRRRDDIQQDACPFLRAIHAELREQLRRPLQRIAKTARLDVHHDLAAVPVLRLLDGLCNACSIPNTQVDTRHPRTVDQRLLGLPGTRASTANSRSR